MHDVQKEPIAIIGIGCRFPGAGNPQAFWNLLREGRDAIRAVPADRWDIEALYDPDAMQPGKMVSRWGGFIDQVDQFDWRAFRILPREVQHMDPQHRLLLEVAWEALEDAGLPLTQVAGSQTSVSIGIGWSDYLRLQSRNWSRLDGYTAMGSASCFAANRLSYIFDLKGPSVSLDAGCTSSLSAIYLACQSLWTGEASLALAGGVNLLLSPDSTIMVSKAGLLSPEGRCKTLDAHADGFVRGEGAGIIVLKALSQVQRSDRVYALIRGIAINHNGHNEWIIAPNQTAQEVLLQEAYRKAGVNPSEVDYVELHGTGFQRGDPVEAKALGTVLGLHPKRTHPCLIGSVKTNIGHLEAASGIASIIKVALSLSQREIPPTLNLQTINPEIPLHDLHLAAPQTTLPWPNKEEVPIAGVTTLAFTGANAHAVLAAHPAFSRGIPPEKESGQVQRLLPLSARSAEALYAQAVTFRDFLITQVSQNERSWRDICYTASVRRTHHEYRLAVTGRTPQEAADALHAFIQGHQSTTGIVNKNSHTQQHKLLYLFTHQGSARSIADHECFMREPAFHAVAEECDYIFRQLSMKPLLEDLQKSRTFNQCIHNEIVHFTLQVSLAALWRSWGIVPDAVLGEGLGEVIAAHVAGALSLKDALQIIIHCTESLPQPEDFATILQELQPQSTKIPIYSTAVGRVNETQPLVTSHWKKQLRSRDLSVAVFDTLLLDGYDVFVEIGLSSVLSGAIFARLQHQDRTGTLLPSLGHQKEARSVLLETLSTLYILGYTVNWPELHKERSHCVSLPTYSWQRERLWPDWLDVEEISTPPEDRQAELQQIENVSRHTYEIETSGRSIEEVLADLWAEVLGLGQVASLESFFELGGHSLLAMQLLARIRAVFQVEVSLGDFFQVPTPVACAALIAQCKASQAESKLTLPSLPLIESNPSLRYYPFPLTDVQQAYWVGRSLAFELGNVGNHGYIEVEADGLDLERLTVSIRRLIERHEMLRAIILPDGQQQILEHIPPFQIKVVDLREQEPQVVATQLEHIRQSMDHQIHSVEQWPAFEIRVSRLDDRRVRLHLSVESLFIDAWSMHILVQEFTHLYYEPDALLPPLQLSFRDYVLAEAALHDSDLYQRSQAYWIRRLPLLPPAPDLPLAQNPSSLDQPHFVHRGARLDSESWRRLKARAAQAGITPSGALLAAFAEVLTTWSKSSRFSINLSLFNRLPLHPQVSSIVGDFTSLSLLAVDNSISDTFEHRARRLQEQLWSDLDYSYYSGIRVLRDLARTQGELVKAIIPVVFTSLLVQDTASQYPSPWQDTIYCVSQTPQVWLDHQVLEAEGTLVFHWQAVEALFPEGLLDAMFGAYCQLLQRLATVEESWQELVQPLVPRAQLEQRALINATEAPVADGLLHTLFIGQVSQRPQQAAMICPGRTLTYEEVYAGSTQLAQQLRQLGARPNELVGVVMEKGWEQIVAVLGVLQSGAAYLPIDPGLPEERLMYLLEHGEVEIVVTQSWIDKKVEWPEQLHRLCVDSLDLQKTNVVCLESVQGPEDLAYVIYTSGSTGLPKGVMIDHRGAVNTIIDINERFGVNSDDRVLALSSLNFDLSVYDIFGILAVGGTIVMPAEETIRNPAAWTQMLVQEQVTIWNSVPSLLKMLVEYAEIQPGSLSRACLRVALLCGDWIPLPLAGRLKELIPGVEVISLGGATEASIWSIFYPITQIDPSWTSIPYGRPLHNQQFHVLNEALELCPVWVPGQLYIAGLGLARGYWRDEEKTCASFLTHPQTGARLYRTGDLGRYLPDGNIEFLGREDFQVKVQGYRIELGEIEAVLAGHPAIREVIVTAVGERHGDKRLVAYVVPRQEHTLSSSQLRYFLQEQLPSYMVPSTFLFLDGLPLSANGKVDRKALPTPSQAIVASSQQKPTVETALIAEIVQVVASVLEVDSLDPEANLLECGASSLNIVRIVNLLERLFHFRPKLDEFFRFPTVVWLAISYEKHLLHARMPTEGVEQDREPSLRSFSGSLAGEREEGDL
jgi:pyochelin synthetase